MAAFSALIFVKTRFICQTTLLPAWFLLLGHSSPEYVLKYKMKAGEIRYYTASMDAVLVQELGGVAYESRTRSVARVKFVGEGQSSIDRMRFIISNESLAITVSTIDTDSTFANPPGMTGKRVRKIITANGDQIASEELDPYEQLSAAPGFGSEQEFLTNLPGTAMRMGETVMVTDVDSTHRFGGIMVSTAQVAYTLVGIEMKQSLECVHLQIKGQISLRGQGERQGVQFSLDGEGSIVGTLYFAHKQGLLVSSENTTELGMRATVTDTKTTDTIPIFQTVQFSLLLSQ